jgi:hypothetical protein
MDPFKRRWTARILIGALVLVSLAACGTRRAPLTGSAATTPAPSFTPSNAEGMLDYEHPLPPDYVVSLDEALAKASFPLILPSPDLGTPVIYLDTVESSGETPVYFVFLHPTYGVFEVIEYPTDLKQSDLEDQLSLNGSPGVQVRFSIVTIRDGVRAVLTEGGGGYSVEWLGAGRDVAVVGPIDTFTADYAIEVANKL